MSLIDSHETMLERPRLSTATLGWQVPHYVVPQHSRPVAAPVLLSDRYAAAKRHMDVVVSLLALAAQPNTVAAENVDQLAGEFFSLASGN